jgi:hypothetical protein
MATTNGNNFDNIESELIELFKQINSELPSQVAELELAQSRSREDGVGVTLKPRNPLSASAWCHAWNSVGRIHFGFGEYSPAWELPDEGENPNADKAEILREVGEMCRAVIHGCCEHQRRLMGITARLKIQGKNRSVTDLLIFWPRPPLWGTRKYLPWD